MAFVHLDGFNESGKELDITAKWEDEAETKLLCFLQGIMDTNNSNLFNDAVGKELSGLSRCDRVVFDLAGITYLSSTGIGTLSNIMVQCKKKNIPFFLTKVPDKIKRIMSQLGFLIYFKFLDS